MKAGVPTNTLPAAPAGARWALSRILTQGPSGFDQSTGFRTAAQAQNLAPTIHVYYPPMNVTKTGYAQTHALVRMTGTIGSPNADTDLLPNLALTDTLGANAASVRTLLESRCIRYRYVDWAKATVGKPLIPVSAYSSSTLFSQVLADIFQHLEQTTYRPKPNTVEDHNTEYTDDFSTDPAARWTAELSSFVWDGTDFEMDIQHAGANVGIRYTANSPGSIEHEAQVTGIVNTSEGVFVGPAVRFDNTGVDDFYALTFQDDNTVKYWRFNAGTRTELASHADGTYTNGDWFTHRLAAAGTAGNNVVLSSWILDHNASKPSDPGWIGVDGSPDSTFTDSNANRLDDSVHAQGGIGGRSATSSDYDTRLDFWKVRALSDRGGAASVVGPLLAGKLTHGGILTRGRLARC